MSRLYAIVDTARDPKLYPLVTGSQAYSCLFAGNIPEPLNQASPYLVDLEEDTPLKLAWRDEGWGAAWGMLCLSPLELDDLRRHLRKFLLVQLPDGDTVFFRFYDPRVWRIYWPTCNAEERAKWLEGLDEFVAEDSLVPARAPGGGKAKAGLSITLRVKLDVVVGGRPKGQAEVTPGAPFEIGRHGSGCRVDDQILSRRHFLLEALDDRLYVEDLGSANGTYLNGSKVEGRAEVDDGDRIEAGQSAFTVHISALKRQRIGETGWVAIEAPEGWSLAPQFGFQRQAAESSETVSCGESILPPDRPLQDHVGARVRALRGILPDFAAERLDPSEVGGDPSGFAALLAYRFRGERICQYHYYLPAGDTVGSMTWTKSGPPSPEDLAEFKRLIGHLSFDPANRPVAT